MPEMGYAVVGLQSLLLFTITMDSVANKDTLVVLVTPYLVCLLFGVGLRVAAVCRNPCGASP